MQARGDKPFTFLKKGAHGTKTRFPTALVWLAVFAVLAVAGGIFLFKTFDWYSLIIIVVFVAIGLYKQKHH